MKSVTRSIRISPQKLNLIAKLIRKKSADNALEILEFVPKKGAKILHKALKSAVANATNNFKQDASSLYIKEITVNKAPTFKRWIPASRGRVNPILKRNSHLTITVAVKEETQEKPEAKKEANKNTEKPSKTITA